MWICVHISVYYIEESHGGACVLLAWVPWIRRYGKGRGRQADMGEREEGGRQEKKRARKISLKKCIM